MASVSYAEDLACSACLTIFTDPVTLPCGHSFCRQCITKFLVRDNPICPHGPASFYGSLSKIQKRKCSTIVMPVFQVAELCPEHEEKLKLFCITDQQLACIICRDGEEHEGHRFKPVKEAAASLRKELETFEQHAADDIHAIETLADIQKNEMFKTREKSQQLTIQIKKQFQEMHDFLRRRENEIKRELKHKEEDSVGKMREALEAVDIVLSDSRELKEKVNLVLKISEPENFLRSWTEGNKMGTSGHVVRPRLNELQGGRGRVVRAVCLHSEKDASTRFDPHYLHSGSLSKTLSF
uniref:Uncharacterized protein n=1 Tax=Fundulus heteroclitus TaxID=8078 RepID=A0A3Q2PU05_FUNHE